MKKRQQRFVITGGTGFIGSFLINRLVELGYKNIIVTSRTKQDVCGVVTYRICDILKDKSILNDTIKKGDIVIHLACSSSPLTSEINRIKEAEENIVGTINLLETCAEKKIKKIIFVSSGGAIYGGDSKKSFKESDSTNPENSYGVTKLAIEKYINVFHCLYGMKFVIARVSNLYGKKVLSNEQNGVIDVFLNKAKNNKSIQIFGDGKNTRDYIYIKDVIDFLILAIEKDNVSGIFNIGTGTGVTLNQIVKTIEKITKTKFLAIYNKKGNAGIKRSVLDISKAKKIGWNPKYTYIEGIKKTTI